MPVSPKVAVIGPLKILPDTKKVANWPGVGLTTVFGVTIVTAALAPEAMASAPAPTRPITSFRIKTSRYATELRIS